MKSVCFGCEGKGSAQRYFRGELPAQALARHGRGWSTMVAELLLPPESPVEIAHDPRLRGGNFVKDQDGKVLDLRVTEPPPDIVTIRLMDNVDLSRPEWPDYAMPESIERARAAGQIVLYDLDDDVWNIPEWSPAHNARSPLNPRMRAVDKKALNENMEVVDGAICSTPRIAEALEAQVPGTKTWVVRNGIDPALYRWPRRPAEHRPLRVGWMGSLSHHLPHLRTIWEALGVLNEYQAEFVFCGWAPQIDQQTQDFFHELPVHRTKAIPWVDFPLLPSVLEQIDVGIIPRVDTPFNEGQSTTSGMQYACAGVPFVAFDSDEYRSLSEAGAGIVARGQEEWEVALAYLLGDEEVRDWHRQSGRKTVAKLHGPAVVGKAYHELLGDLVSDRVG